MNCRECAYSKRIPGDTHISCKFNWTKNQSTTKKMPQGESHGVRNGWFNFPFNFDPIWMIGKCEQFATETNPEHIMPDNPLFDLFSLLR